MTRRGDLKTKLAAFEQGVDDIMTIPFSPEELLARVLVITRRALRPSSIPFNPVLKLGELEIDILHRQVRAGTSELHLTGLEQSLLYLLAASAGQVVTRDEILDALWGVDYVSESNVVDRHVRNLRAKLQNDWRKPRFIATVPGTGYRFIPTFSDPERASTIRSEAARRLTPVSWPRGQPGDGSTRTRRGRQPGRLVRRRVAACIRRSTSWPSSVPCSRSASATAVSDGQFSIMILAARARARPKN